MDFTTLQQMRDKDLMDEMMGITSPVHSSANIGLSGAVAPAVSASQKAGMDLATAGSAAATPFMATPGGAAVLIGSQIAMQMAAQNAAANQAKRQRDMEIAQNKGAGEERGFQTIMEGLRSSLR